MRSIDSLTVPRRLQGIYALLLVGTLGAVYLVDDALDQDDADVDAAGYIGQELGNEVVDGGCCQADGVAVGAGGKTGLAAGNVEVADFVVTREADHVGVVHHAAAVVALRPHHLVNRMGYTPLHGGVGHAVVVRVLMGDGGNEESAEELTGHVLRVADAHIAAKPGHAGAVGGVGVGAHGNGGDAEDGNGVEGVGDVANGEPGFLPRRHGLDLGTVEEAVVPVDEGFDGGNDGGEGRFVGRACGWRELSVGGGIGRVGSDRSSRGCLPGGNRTVPRFAGGSRTALRLRGIGNLALGRCGVREEGKKNNQGR